VALWFIISLIVSGLIVGALARLALPGPDPMSIPATILLGVAGGSATAMFLAVDALPVLVLTQRALLWRTDHEGRIWYYPPGRLVMWLVGLGVAAIVAAAIWLSGDPGGLQGAVFEVVRRSLGQFAGLGEAAQRLLASVFPGVAVWSWLLMVTLNGILAQGVLARFNRNRRPSPDLASLDLPWWTPVALGVAALLPAVGPGNWSYVGTNVVLVLLLAFLFGGLAVVHALARRFTARPAILVSFYVVSIVFGWPLLLVAALGFLEHWVGLRQRFAMPAAGPQGDE
jgi:hypothetical protein